VIRLVHVEHAVGEHAEYARHPPAQSGNGAVVLAQGEHAAVFEHARGGLLRRGHPDPADDRELDLDDRPGRLQLLEAGGRVAEKILAGEIHVELHGTSSRQSRPGL
jgi:hypothetical protein